MTGTRIVVGIACGFLLLYLIATCVASLDMLLNFRDAQTVSRAMGGWLVVILFFACSIPGLLAIPTTRFQQSFRRTALAANITLLCFTSLGALISILVYAANPALSGRNLNVSFVVCSILGLSCLAATLALVRLGWLLPPTSDLAPPPRKLAARCCLIAGVLLFGGTASLAVVSISRSINPAARAESPSLTSSNASTTARFADLNYKLKLPPKPWVRRKPPNTAISLALQNEPEGLTFFVIAERLGDDPGMTLATLRDLVISNVRAKIPDFIAEDPVPRNVAGINGLYFAATGHDNTDMPDKPGKVDYRYWLGFHNGFSYQLITCRTDKGADGLDDVAASLLDRYSLIDSEAKVVASGGSSILLEHSGLTLDLSNSGWLAWKDIQSTAPMAAAGAKRGASGAMALVPINLAGLDPHPDALAHALFEAIGTPYPAPDIKPGEPYSKDGVRGRRFSATRQVDGRTFEYRYRVLRRDDAAWLAAAWQLPGTGDPAELDRFLDRITLASATPKLDPESLPADVRTRQGQILNAIGLYYYAKSQFPAAVKALRLASDFNPVEPVILRNTVDALSQLDQHAEALALLAQRIASFPDDTDLAERHASLLALTKDADGAIAAYSKLFESGWRDPEALDPYVRLLLEKDQADRAEQDLARFSDGEADSYRTLRAAIRRKQKRDDEAIAVLRQGVEATPVDTAAAEDLIDIYDDLERYTEVIEVCDLLSKAEYATPFTLYYRGLAEMNLDRLPAAKTSFEAAARLKPGDATLKEALDAINTRLGKGDTAAIRDPIEPVPLPEAALAGIEAFQPDAGAVFEYRISALKFEPGKTLRCTDYLKATVIDRRGLEPLNSFVFAFESTYERIYVNSLEVRDQTGAVVFTGDPSTYYIADQSTPDHATQERALHIPVGALSPGRTVSLVVTREDNSPSHELPFRRHFFAAVAPVARQAFVVHADPRRLQHRETPGVKVTTFDGGIIFSADKTPAWRDEPRQSSPETFVPNVRFCGTATTWDNVARKYLERIAPRLEMDPSVSDLAAKLTAGAADDGAKLRAIARHVQEDYTYKAISFGPRAQIPAPAKEIIANRYGDCKDHALLAHLLLRAAGIKSNLVLVSSEMELDPDLPDNGQFDHIVLHLPDAGRFLDLTDKQPDPLMSPPYGMARTSVLVLDPESPRLVALPDYPADLAAIDIAREVWLDGRDLRVEERLISRGIAAAPLRTAVRAAGADLVREFAPDFANGIELTKTTAEHADDPSLPLTLNFSYRVPAAFVDAENRLAGSLPYVWERHWCEAEYVSERITPFEIPYGVAIQATVRLHLPSGCAVASPESLEFTRSSDFATSERRIESKPDGLHIRSTIRLKPGKYRADQYRHFAEFVNQSLSSLERDVVLKRN